ncbi:MAG: hypothetical protein AAFU78_09970 [Cyanobacteria bacterium J06633_2]
MISRISKLKFPLWQYLKQPVFQADNPLILNPSRYWFMHRASHLERCWLIHFEPEKGSRNT